LGDPGRRPFHRRFFGLPIHMGINLLAAIEGWHHANRRRAIGKPGGEF
jgi:hypothetical protein